jgi:hypothetical protein
MAVPKALRRKIYETYFESTINRNADVRTVFETIHERNWWHSGESRSGLGSELSRTEEFRQALQEWLERHKTEIKTVLDAPCGDFNWMRAVALPGGVRYLGGDIVRPLIAEHMTKFQSEVRSFVELDIIAGPLPVADAWICRDVLFHFPFAAGVAVINNFRASGCRYFLSTTYAGEDNRKDIKFGWFRPVNLERPPFNLGRPIEMIRDAPQGEHNRFLGVWRNYGV